MCDSALMTLINHFPTVVVKCCSPGINNSLLKINLLQFRRVLHFHHLLSLLPDDSALTYVPKYATHNRRLWGNSQTSVPENIPIFLTFFSFGTRMIVPCWEVSHYQTIWRVAIIIMWIRCYIIIEPPSTSFRDQGFSPTGYFPLKCPR